LLKTSHFNETVQILDKISRDFYLRTSKGEKNFEQFCQGFCTLNEPIRHFFSGMLISDQYANESRHLDLGYPITTVLGTKLFMDPNLFGVKIVVKDDQGRESVVSTANRKHKESLQVGSQTTTVEKTGLNVDERSFPRRRSVMSSAIRFSRVTPPERPVLQRHSVFFS
uniref:RGS domain-containing protein n=1 Tax=Heligmosomoides polygyrus TaxID=6339 RepID=A0A183F9A0_HELPZ